jgi:murein DD-endopeptidase MepM/ murein hydrolase activator NlpD
MYRSLRKANTRPPLWFWLALVLAGIGALVAGAYLFLPQARSILNGDYKRLMAWFGNASDHPDWSISAQAHCGNGAMLFPTEGFIGFDRGDSFRPGHIHSGFDIFSPSGQEGVSPIYAAYDGYLTRESSWLSTVIIRHPNFQPIVNGAQIWSYYTHMASGDGTQSFIDSAFPAGTYDVFVPAGTLLGYQGTWSGDPADPVGLHLHFSIVKSAGNGSYLNEGIIQNTFDPAPFLGVVLGTDGIYTCPPQSPK